MSGALHTPLCDLLGCRYPIVQTAMGWVAGSSLVAATTNASIVLTACRASSAALASGRSTRRTSASGAR